MNTPSNSGRRPAPRRSSLAGQSPIAPPAERQPAPAQGPSESPQPREKAEEPKQADKATKYRHKVSFYQDPEDTARVRGAILHTMTTEGARTLSQFIHNAVMREVERLEAKYNNGEPFRPVGARELPQGRPMGEGRS